MTLSRLFIIAGDSTSGKDEIIRAVYSLGGCHAKIISKYTSRKQRADDGPEIICSDNPKFIDYKNCDISYEVNDRTYYINSNDIWDGMRTGLFQVISVSDAKTINILKSKFGNAVVLVYVHSSYSDNKDDALELFTTNFDKFNHVLIYEGIKEDLYDQIFRLFRAYEKGYLN